MPLIYGGRDPCVPPPQSDILLSSSAGPLSLNPSSECQALGLDDSILPHSLIPS